MIDYTLIASFVLYFVVLRLIANSLVGPIAGAAIISIGSFVISAIPQAILSSSVVAVFGWQSILTMILQFIIATVIFSKLRQYEDSLATWFILGLAGAIILLVATPTLVMYVI